VNTSNHLDSYYAIFYLNKQLKCSSKTFTYLMTGRMVLVDERASAPIQRWLNKTSRYTKFYPAGFNAITQPFISWIACSESELTSEILIQLRTLVGILGGLAYWKASWLHGAERTYIHASREIQTPIPVLERYMTRAP